MLLFATAAVGWNLPYLRFRLPAVVSFYPAAVVNFLNFLFIFHFWTRYLYVRTRIIRVSYEYEYGVSTSYHHQAPARFAVYQEFRHYRGTINTAVQCCTRTIAAVVVRNKTHGGHESCSSSHLIMILSTRYSRRSHSVAHTWCVSLTYTARTVSGTNLDRNISTM